MKFRYNTKNEVSVDHKVRFREKIFGEAMVHTLDGENGDDWLNGNLGTDFVDGGDGNDFLEGNDTLTGNQGRDRFLLRSGEGSDLITDFVDTEDLFVLDGGLTFVQLSIIEENGSTLIKFGEELLATLENVNASLITAEDFVSLF